MGNHKLQARISKAKSGAFEIQIVREFIQEVIGGVSEVDPALGEELEKGWLERGFEFLSDPELFMVFAARIIGGAEPETRATILSNLEQRKEYLIQAVKDEKKKSFFR